MPTISQLPIAASVTAGDTVPISQNGAAHSVSIGALLSETQPALVLAQGALLGRVSLGPGGPEEIAIGAGLLLNAATLQVVSALGTASNSDLRALPLTTAPTGQDLIGIDQTGTIHAISYANLINGQTIDSAQPAAAASDSDTFWVGQGGNTMVGQSFSAVWPWIASKLVSYKAPVIEIGVNTTLDGTVHNARVLVCSQPLTLTPILSNMGSGFQCEVVNLSTGTVLLAGTTISSTGTSSLAPGQAATVRCLTYTGGTVVYASIGNGSSGAPANAPGAVGGLAVTNATPSSVLLNWQAPSSGTAPTSYTIQYREHGTSNWTGSVSGISGTSRTVTGLNANTAYDFVAIAVSSSGSGPLSAVATGSTTAQSGSVTSIIWNIAPSGSYIHGSGAIGVNVHVAPSTSAVQFGFSNAATVAPSSWTAGSFVNTDLWGAYVPIPATAGTWYAWASGTDGSAPTAYATAFTVT